MVGVAVPEIVGDWCVPGGSGRLLSVQTESFVFVGLRLLVAVDIVVGCELE